MATVLSRTTKQLIASANTPDFPKEGWIIEPDLSAVKGQPEKYWVIKGDTVALMDQAARDAVDVAEATAAQEAEVEQAKSAYETDKRFAVLFAELNEIRKHLGLDEKTVDDAVKLEVKGG